MDLRNSVNYVLETRLLVLGWNGEAVTMNGLRRSGSVSTMDDTLSVGCRGTFSYHDLANDIHSQAATTVFSHLNWTRNSAIY